jgi:hypothetical protein
MDVRRDITEGRAPAAEAGIDESMRARHDVSPAATDRLFIHDLLALMLQIGAGLVA